MEKPTINFEIPEGWALVPVNPSAEDVLKAEEQLDFYLSDRIEGVFSDAVYMSAFLKTNPPTEPLPTWPDETKSWPNNSRLVYNTLVELVKYKK
jgi:hypothetical protein